MPLLAFAGTFPVIVNTQLLHGQLMTTGPATRMAAAAGTTANTGATTATSLVVPLPTGMVPGQVVVLVVATLDAAPGLNTAAMLVESIYTGSGGNGGGNPVVWQYTYLLTWDGSATSVTVTLGSGTPRAITAVAVPVTGAAVNNYSGGIASNAAGSNTLASRNTDSVLANEDGALELVISTTYKAGVAPTIAFASDVTKLAEAVSGMAGTTSNYRLAVGVRSGAAAATLQGQNSIRSQVVFDQGCFHVASMLLVNPAEPAGTRIRFGDLVGVSAATPVNKDTRLSWGDLQRVSTNLIKNDDIATVQGAAVSAYTTGSNSGTRPTIAADTSVAAYGTQSLKVTTQTADYWWAYVTPPEVNGVRVTPGQVYSGQVAVARPVGSTIQAASARITWSDQNGGYLGGADGSATFLSAGGGFVACKIENAIAPAGAVFATPQVNCAGPPPAVGDALNFGNVMINAGPTTPPWLLPGGVPTRLNAGVLATVASATALPWAGRAVVSTDTRLLFGDLQGLSRDTRLVFGDLGRVTASSRLVYGQLAPVVAAARLVFGGLAVVTANDRLPYNVLASVGTWRALPWAALTSVGKSTRLAFGELSSVGRSTTMPWAQAAVVTASTVLPWSQRAAVTVNSRLAYNDLVGVTRDTRVAFGDLAGVVKQTRLAFGDLSSLAVHTRLPFGDLVALLGPAIGLRYNDLQGVTAASRVVWGDLMGLTAPTTLPWGVRAAVAVSAALPWADRQAVGTSNRLPWAQRAAVTVNDRLAFGDLAAVAGNTRLAFGELAGLTKDVRVPWADRAAVTVTTRVPWSALAVVTVQDRLVWGGLAITTVTMEDRLSWGVLRPVGTSAALPWSDRSAVIKALSVPWNDRQAITSTRALSWSDRASVDTSARLSWADRQALAVVLGLEWDALARVTAGLAVRFAELASVTQESRLAYADLASVSSTTRLRYGQLARVETTSALRWAGIGRVTVATRLLSSVLVSVTVSAGTVWGVLRSVDAQNARLPWAVAQVVTASGSLRWQSLVPGVYSGPDSGMMYPSDDILDTFADAQGAALLDSLYPLDDTLEGARL